jgi:hypothetical protein
MALIKPRCQRLPSNEMLDEVEPVSYRKQLIFLQPSSATTSGALSVNVGNQLLLRDELYIFDQ